MREKLEQHNAPACVACHAKMDPLGLAFENFDAIGTFRTTEAGKPIDASGDLDGQAFAGPGRAGRDPAPSTPTSRRAWCAGCGATGWGGWRPRGKRRSSRGLAAEPPAAPTGSARCCSALVESEGFRVAGDDP